MKLKSHQFCVKLLESSLDMGKRLSSFGKFLWIARESVVVIDPRFLWQLWRYVSASCFGCDEFRPWAQSRISSWKSKDMRKDI